MKKRWMLFSLFAMTAVVAGLIHASSLQFMTDDAFISFRYAKNLVRGLGLVYNSGERVEGFTNFLWTVIVAGGMRLNFDPVNFSSTLSIAFYLGTILLYALSSWKLFGSDEHSKLIIPLTSLALCIHHDVNVYATGGLETAMFMFMVSAGFFALLFAQTSRGFAGSGALLVLAMMTRPDGVVVLFAAALFIVLTEANAWKRLIQFLLPTVLIFVPYWIWRFLYYGYFFPNSFYAKSIDLPYYSQGFQYVALFFKSYYVFAIIPLLGILLVAQYRSTVKESPAPVRFRERMQSLRPRGRGMLLAVLLSTAYLAFIIRIGGDFMFARFLIPVTPLLYFMIEDLLSLTVTGNARVIVAGAIVVATFVRIDYFRDNPMLGYIADEARYYSADQLKRAQADGAILHKYFEGRPVKVGFWAGQVKLVYYSDPAVAIETSTGLTDTVIAHQSLATRGRPGHEKNAPFSYLLKRGVNFYIGPSSAPPEGPIPVNAIVFDKILARVIVFDESLMEQFAQYPEVKYVRVPQYLDSYIASFATYTPDQVRKDFLFLDSFYLTPNNDTARRNAFLAYLSGHPGAAQ
ncbi:MAG TPA: hypothetical protein VL633_06995 [Bacteroidota bacterium]|nr:hypothetical protein [Bacteroidota bacterium]